MDNLKDPSNRINAEASTSSNKPPFLKKRKLSDEEIICEQTRELYEERRMLENVKDELERMKKVEAELQSKIVAVEAQKKAAEAQFVKLKADMNDQLAGLKKENEEKDNKIKKLQATCDGSKKKIKELDAQLQSKAVTENSLRAEMTHMQQNNNDQTKLLQVENDRLKAFVKKHVSTVVQLDTEFEEFQKWYKAKLQKKEDDKKALKDEHEKKMANMKAEMQRKIDNERNEHATAVSRLNSAKEDLLKKIAEEAASEIKRLNDSITVAKNFNAELYSQNKELKQKELNAREHAHEQIIDRDNQIQELQNELAKRAADPTERIVDLDELCDDSGICDDRLLRQNTVIKVGKLNYNGNVLKFCSDSNNRSVRLNISDFLQNIFRFQMNGEFFLPDSHGLYYIKKIMPIVHSWNLRKLDLNRNTIEYDDFMKFVSSRTITTFIGGSVKRENGEMLGAHEILKELPNIENFELKSNGISKTECKKLVELPTFSKLRRFKLQFTKSTTDLLYFAGFFAKHPDAVFTFDMTLLTPKAQQSFLEKVQNLREILPSNCRVFSSKKSSTS